MAVFRGGRRSDDMFVGTAANDRFLFSPAQLNARDTITGGAGYDTLIFKRPGVIDASAMSHVSGVEAVRLADGDNDFSFGRLVDSAENQTLAVQSGSGADAFQLYSSYAATNSFSHINLDGGEGDDTLVLLEDGYTPVSVSLDKQLTPTMEDRLNLSSVENVDGSQAQRGLVLNGSNVDNVLIGSISSDTINGYGGNDILEGGANNTDWLTGGEGSDTFRWTDRDDPTRGSYDYVDFHPGEDKLQFQLSEYDIAGQRFNKVIITDSVATDITGVDLVIYTGSLDAYAYLNAAQGGRSGDGIFVAKELYDGTDVLYHSASAADSHDLVLVAQLGDIGGLSNLTRSDFLFI